jgi:hypothetical protein
MLALTSIALALTYVAAPDAMADQLCYYVWVHGTAVVDPVTVGPLCQPISFGVICETETVGLDPSLLVTEEVCVPRP